MIPIVLDFETYYGDGYSLSLKSVTTESYIRDPRFKVHGVGIKKAGKPSVWVPERFISHALAKCDLPNNAMVGHNLQFDGSILAWHYGIYPKLYIDTLGLSRALVGPHLARHGLKYVAEKLCGMTKMDELSKTYNLRELPSHIELALADYCTGAPRQVGDHIEAGDTELTWAIFKKLIPFFPKDELASLDWTIRAFTKPRLLFDRQMLADYAAQLAREKQEALDGAGLADRKLLMSNPKFAEALESLGVTPPTKINKQGKITFAFAKTDTDFLALQDHEDTRVQALVSARLAHKSTIEETRTAAYLAVAERGPWPVAYNYAGAKVTQRYSGNKGGGGNPQNLKRGGVLRNAIYAPEGYVIGVPDLSQIEARLTLWFGMQITGPEGEEAKALRVMSEGGDIYSWFGTRIYGVPISKYETPFERQISKSAVLGLGFGMGWARFIEYCKQNNIYGITEEFAQHTVKLYRNTFIGVKQFWSQCTKAINAIMDGQDDIALPFDGIQPIKFTHDPIFNQPAILLPSGLYVKYPNLNKSPEGEITYTDGATQIKLFGGKITENIVQATAGWIMRNQSNEINRVYPVVMSTHDEMPSLVPEAHDDLKEWDDDKGKYDILEEGQYTKFVKEIMTRPIAALPGLPLGVEVGTGIRYGQAKQ